MDFSVPGESLSFGLELDKISNTKAGEEQQQYEGERES